MEDGTYMKRAARGSGTIRTLKRPVIELEKFREYGTNLKRPSWSV